MQAWKCGSCGCEYRWIDPEVVNGVNFCEMCADDPPPVKPTKVATIHPVFWLLLGCFIGLFIGKMLWGH